MIIDRDPGTIGSYARAPDALHAELEGETVMMSVARGEYFGLNSMGSRIWALLEVPHTLDELCARLLAEFEVEDARCRREVSGFLSELLRLGMVTTRAAGESAPVGPSAIA